MLSAAIVSAPVVDVNCVHMRSQIGWTPVVEQPSGHEGAAGTSGQQQQEAHVQGAGSAAASRLHFVSRSRTPLGLLNLVGAAAGAAASGMDVDGGAGGQAAIVQGQEGAAEQGQENAVPGPATQVALSPSGTDAGEDDGSEPEASPAPSSTGPYSSLSPSGSPSPPVSPAARSGGGGDQSAPNSSAAGAGEAGAGASQPPRKSHVPQSGFKGVSW